MAPQLETQAPRRVSVERGIYRRADGKFEIGYRDGSGRQRWRVIHGDIEVARAKYNLAVQERLAARDELVAELLRKDREAGRRSRADYGHAYASVRQALQSLDKAPHVRGLSPLLSRAQTALYRAEDDIVELMRHV